MTQRMTYHDARARALFRELDANPELVVLGGHLTLPWNPETGIEERYPGRLIWPPISEFATAGIGVGAAMAGLRVLVPLSTSSFMFYGWPALVQEAANVRYLSGGKAQAPVAFHTMAGSRDGAGAQHEHTPHAMLQNVPGLRIFAPGTPANIDTAVHLALTGADPTLIADHVRLVDAEGPVEDAPRERLDVELLRAGNDALIVAYSVLVQRSLRAAATLERDGLSVAVLNVPCLHPLPVEDVVEAVRSFERVVFADESRAPGSPATYMMAAVLEAALPCRARLVCFGNAPSPHATQLLAELAPSEERITDAVRELSRSDDRRRRFRPSASGKEQLTDV